MKAYKRSTGFSIYTYDQENFDPAKDPKYLVYHHDPLSGCPSPIMNVTVNSVTQGLVFINKRHPGYRSNCPRDELAYTGIELCEVKVLGMLSRFKIGQGVIPSLVKAIHFKIKRLKD